MSYPTSKTRRGRVQGKGLICPTITSQSMNIYRMGSDILKEKEKEANDYRIRRLTPKECWRLMGFSDEQFDRAKWYTKEESKEFLNNHPKHYGKRQFTEEERVERISDSQLYKQAGNSIVVDVLYYIYKELYTAMPYLFEDLKVMSCFSGIGAFESGLDRLYDDINGTATTECVEFTSAVASVIYDDYNGVIKANQNQIGTITTNIGYKALRNGSKLIEEVNNA